MSGTSPHCALADGNATRTLARHCQYLLPTLESLQEQKPDLTLLDVGCGSGALTVDFALRLAPRGHVVGVDLSAAVLASATALAAYRDVRNVHFTPADVLALPFRDGAFDLVHAHQVLAHVAHPSAAIRELLRVTRTPGGAICLREGDLESAHFSPASPALEECFEVIRSVHRGNGGDAAAGRKLEGWAVAAGVARENIVAGQSEWCCATREERQAYAGHWPARCSYGLFAERARELGVTESRLQQFAVAWRQWIDDKDGELTMGHGELIIRT